MAGWRKAVVIVILCLSSLSARAEIVGKIFQYKSAPEDTPYAIARQFDLGIEQLAAANPGHDFSAFVPGATLTVPSAYIVPPVKQGEIVVNLAERRLYYRSAQGLMTFPVAIGKRGWETPLGETYITKKRRNPVWVPPDSLRAETPNLPVSIPPGPENPLGAYALNLGWNGFVIHGTNIPGSIGREASHGCIRMYPEDIEQLFDAVDAGTKVTVIYAPYKADWWKDELYLQVSPASFPDGRKSVDEAYHEILRISGTAEIDWKKVDDALSAREGMPVLIGYRAGKK